MENGEAVKEKSLVLKDQGLILPGLAQHEEDVDREMVISYSELAEYLNEAEKRRDLITFAHRFVSSFDPATTLRLQERTPPEEFESGGYDGWFQLQELNERESSGRKR
jgi:hypothetical protein